MSWKDTDEFQEFIKEEAFAEFVSTQSMLLKTMMGARNNMSIHDWQDFKSSVEIPQYDYGNPLRKFHGVYPLLEDITGQDLGILASDWNNMSLLEENEAKFDAGLVEYQPKTKPKGRWENIKRLSDEEADAILAHLFGEKSRSSHHMV